MQDWRSYRLIVTRNRWGDIRIDVYRGDEFVESLAVLDQKQAHSLLAQLETLL